MQLLLSTSQTATIITTVTIILILGIILSLRGKKFDARIIAYAAVCIGVSFALSYVKVDYMPYGGSVTLASFIPLILFSYVFGIRSGLFAGAIYGLLQFIQAPYFLTPVQFLLDYILGFASIAAAGLIGLIIKDNRKGLIISVPVVYLIRLTMHILAGFIFYSSVTDRAGVLPLFGDTSAMSGFIYSSLYNISYILPDMVICLVVLIIMVSNKGFLRLVEQLKLNHGLSPIPKKSE